VTRLTSIDRRTALQVVGRILANELELVFRPILLMLDLHTDVRKRVSIPS